MQPRKNASSQRLVGAQLALFRRLAGYTQRELADRLNIGEETIASIEQGRRPLKGDLAERLDLELGTRGVLAVSVEYMPEAEKYPVWAAEFIDHERQAVTLSWYENQVVPGLLQTEGYVRSVFHNEIPALTDEEIELRVAARLERQCVLHRKEPPTASFVISEVALLDRFGGEEVFAEQLAHLRQCADRPGLSLQVMPIGREEHAGLSGPFILIETPEHLHIAYAESQRGGQLISVPGEVSILARKYAMLRTQALNRVETKRLLDRLLGER
ncbi:Scr1 family TA system antitoxin-like transcriptional regulator [Streptomyces sp. NPDC053560]|uniref:helix-turn-helix domain-containing protein n=1 Tax=Streptomyces sp. NPDC053560 TaxID=3365711 RepID=UPI0037CF7D36